MLQAKEKEAHGDAFSFLLLRRPKARKFIIKKCLSSLLRGVITPESHTHRDKQQVSTLSFVFLPVSLSLSLSALLFFGFLSKSRPPFFLCCLLWEVMKEDSRRANRLQHSPTLLLRSKKTTRQAKDLPFCQKQHAHNVSPSLPRDTRGFKKDKRILSSSLPLTRKKKEGKCVSSTAMMISRRRALSTREKGEKKNEKRKKQREMDGITNTSTSLYVLGDR